MHKETKTRSILKAILWRVIATANSYLILTSGFTSTNIGAALLMNFTGLITYFYYERLWNIIKSGKTTQYPE
tara:strand:- start:269 stop:484 length:216 start_codon:yes stop_codon:yes gene_type:complete